MVIAREVTVAMVAMHQSSSVEWHLRSLLTAVEQIPHFPSSLLLVIMVSPLKVPLELVKDKDGLLVKDKNGLPTKVLSGVRLP